MGNDFGDERALLPVGALAGNRANVPYSYLFISALCGG